MFEGKIAGFIGEKMFKEIKCGLGAAERTSVERKTDANEIFSLTYIVKVYIMHNIPILCYNKGLGILMHSRTLAEYFFIAVLGDNFYSPTGTNYIQFKIHNSYNF